MTRDATGLFTETPAGFRARDVVVRPARPDEWRRWDELVDRHHYLGFRRFAGHGLRYVIEWRGMWLGAAGWQSGAFKCGPRDRWIRWARELQFQRLHLIVNNTRFVLFGAPGVFPDLASHALSRMTRRLSDDWRERWGHGLLVAESFVDPARFGGGMYRAAGWRLVGRSKGYSRSNGGYVREPGAGPKDLHVLPLRRDALRLLRRDGELGDGWQRKGRATGLSASALRRLVDHFADIPDFRRAQGRRYSAAALTALLTLAKVANNDSTLAASQFGASLDQRELEALGMWRSGDTGPFVAPSNATLSRFLQHTDPDGLEAAIRAWTVPNLQGGEEAIAVDGKCIRGACRNGGGERWETVTMVEHGSMMPYSILGVREGGGEAAAVRAALETVPLEGRMLTFDALHTSSDVARLVVEAHGADWMMTVKGNTSDTWKGLAGVDWARHATGRWSGPVEVGRGRIERRSIEVLTPVEGAFDIPHVKQVFRVTREREVVKDGGGPRVTEALGMTSDGDASPEQLLAWNRGHWHVEAHHNVRDGTFREDACRLRTGHGPANSATINAAAIAVIRRYMAANKALASLTIAAMRRHFSFDRREALKAMLDEAPAAHA